MAQEYKKFTTGIRPDENAGVKNRKNVKAEK